MTNIIHKPAAEFLGAEEHEGEVEPGQWYFCTFKNWEGKEVTRLACVMHIGSNYILVKTVYGTEKRYHVDNWAKSCERCTNPDEYLKERQDHYQNKVQSLMAEVQEITRRLGVSKRQSLPRQTTQALATRGDTNYDAYKAELVKAKETTLPELFQAIKDASENLNAWMLAPTFPMEASIGDQKEVISAVEERVFNVELYAGLTEEIVQFADGEPAEMGEKLHLMQRRHYMDEECLVNYKTGGMKFDDLSQFNNWLAQPENRDRIFPFPRCMVAFQVRRKLRSFQGFSLHSFIDFVLTQDLDKATFLYIRNGERLYCLQSKIDFGPKLFPDLDSAKFSSTEEMYARKKWGIDLLTKREYDVLKAEYEKELQEYRLETKAWKKAKALYKKDPENNPEPDYFGPHAPSNPLEGYRPFDETNVYYDDVVEHIQGEANRYNRIALIIQGLFDRSEVLHPHPKVRTWDPQGFMEAIELHYDDDRALTSGDAPDFEEYRKRLSASLKKGSRVVGQSYLWEQEVLAQREDHYGNTRWISTSDAPPDVCKIDQWKPRAKKAVFRWKVRTGWSAESDWKTKKFECDSKHLFNIDAYTPGDFRQFFNDPRTRAEYLQWAPLLLVAEEYHAGNYNEKTDTFETKADADVCDRCGETWWRSHSCKKPPSEDLE